MNNNRLLSFDKKINFFSKQLHTERERDKNVKINRTMRLTKMQINFHHSFFLWNSAFESLLILMKFNEWRFFTSALYSVEIPLWMQIEFSLYHTNVCVFLYLLSGSSHFIYANTENIHKTISFNTLLRIC